MGDRGTSGAAGRHPALAAILDRQDRTTKPREFGITVVLDRGEIGPDGVRDLLKVSAAYVDYAKIAWASALIVGALDEKLEAYRSAGVRPMIGGTMFEYAWLREKVPELLAFAKDTGLHIEISDGVAEMPRKDKLHWIGEFAKIGEVFSEVGGKLAHQDLAWKEAIAEEFSAGARLVVIEGREIGAVGQDIRVDFVEMIASLADPKKLVFEALERKQQWNLIKILGPNVNLGNIPVEEAIAVETYRLGLKDRTMMQIFERGSKR